MIGIIFFVLCIVFQINHFKNYGIPFHKQMLFQSSGFLRDNQRTLISAKAKQVLNPHFRSYKYSVHQCYISIFVLLPPMSPTNNVIPIQGTLTPIFV